MSNLINLVGKHTGWFEAYYVMEIPKEEYDKYLAEHPDYDMAEDPDEIWTYFKGLGYDDEIENSCDYDTVLREIEVEEAANETN